MRRTAVPALCLLLAACGDEECVLDLSPSGGTIASEVILTACVTCQNGAAAPEEGATVTFSSIPECPCGDSAAPCSLCLPASVTNSAGCTEASLRNQALEALQITVTARSAGAEDTSAFVTTAATPTPVPTPTGTQTGTPTPTRTPGPPPTNTPILPLPIP